MSDETRHGMPMLRVYSRRLPLTLWYHGMVAEDVTSYHEVARLVGLASCVTGGQIVRNLKQGRHWLLTEGEKT